MEQLPLLSGESKLEWILRWAKEHDYPAIHFQFGRKGYYLSHGYKFDSTIYGLPGASEWEKMKRAPQLNIDILYERLQNSEWEEWKDYEEYDPLYGWDRETGRYHSPS